jgi:hypothetical protein
MRPRTVIRMVISVGLGLGVSAALGCGITRTSDTSRTATEQLLISNAIDQSVERIDFRPLAGKAVFFDAQYLDGTVDKGYLASSIRQHLLASGALLQEDRSKATYVVEARSGGVGTDNHQLLLGLPQMQMPVAVPGAPAAIPEIPLAKKTDQLGVAKVAVFAYNRLTGQAVMQSGMMEATSAAKDLWVLGAGPFQEGSIRRGVVFAGEEIPTVFNGKPTEPPAPPSGVSVVQAAHWSEKPAMPPPVPAHPREAAPRPILHPVPCIELVPVPSPAELVRPKEEPNKKEEAKVTPVLPSLPEPPLALPDGPVLPKAEPAPVVRIRDITPIRPPGK